MEIRRIRMSVALLTLLSIATFIGNSEQIAVMSIDIGSEWMKVAIVSPGVPMEIALNKESKRKTPVAIAFRKGERTFGEDAQAVGVKSPQHTFSHILDLLGKPIDNPMVQLFSKRFPYYDIIADTERNTIAFRLDENTTYTPEELLAQILHKGKEFAESSVGQKINEAVITVPGFFNQAERKALIQAAELADLKVLQLINDYTAVALIYGIYRRKEITDLAHYIMFYDMGASSTTATIVSYQNVKTKERGFVETNPHVSVLGVGYDRTLGGLEMQIRLRNYLAKQFDAQNKTVNSVFNSPRAMAKLFKEAGRVKNVLSANADHFAQIEGLLDEQDFRLQVSREKLEELCSDLFDRVANPVKTALETSALTMDVISHVVLVGAGTRMPKIQNKLSEFVKTELSKNINTDEAAALGAVYKAADLSQGFKVKKFITKDAVLFPVQIVFDRTVDNRVKQVRRTLFGKMNAYPQKKIITFNKHVEDFEFHVNYAEMDYIPPHEVMAIGNLNLTTIKLRGISEALEKHTKEGAEIKGIKAHFSIDESGVLKLANVELVSEKSSTAAEEEQGSDDKETVETVDEQPKEDVKPVHEEPEGTISPKEAEEKEKRQNETKISDDKLSNKTEKTEKEKKPTIVTVKEPIQSEEIKMGPQTLFGEKLSNSREKLHNLDLHDSEKARRETALNNLESFVIEAQQRLDSEEYSKAATSSEHAQILKACSMISDWLEDGHSENAEFYEEALAQLKSLTNDVYERVAEHKERPEVLKGMVSMLNGSRTFLMNMRNLSLTSSIFTQVEIDTLDKVINETQDYHDTVTKSFAETPLHENVKYTVRDMANKMALLDREVKYLVNKAKLWKPKQETPANNTDTTSQQTTDSKEESEQQNVTSNSDAHENASESEEDEKPSDNTEQKPRVDAEFTPQDRLSIEEVTDEAQSNNEKVDGEEIHQEL